MPFSKSWEPWRWTSRPGRDAQLVSREPRQASFISSDQGSGFLGRPELVVCKLLDDRLSGEMFAAKSAEAELTPLVSEVGFGFLPKPVSLHFEAVEVGVVRDYSRREFSSGCSDDDVSDWYFRVRQGHLSRTVSYPFAYGYEL